MFPMPLSITPSPSIQPIDPHLWVDLTKLTEDDLPLILIEDDLRGWMGFLIKNHDKGHYNHAEILYKPNLIATQGWFYTSIPVTRKMTPNIMIKVWGIKNLTQQEKDSIITPIEWRLKLPWWRRRYDILGIFGQAVHLEWLQSPWSMYCSEEVRKDYVSKIPRANSMIKQFPSPSDLNRAFEANPEIFELRGYWWSD